MHIITVLATGSATTDEKARRVPSERPPARPGKAWPARGTTDDRPTRFRQERIERRLDERPAGDGCVWIRRKKTTNLIGAIHPLPERASSRTATGSGRRVSAIERVSKRLDQRKITNWRCTRSFTAVVDHAVCYRRQPRRDASPRSWADNRQCFLDFTILSAIRRKSEAIAIEEL